MSRQFSMGEYIRSYQANLQPAFNFQANTADEWMQWREQFFPKLLELMGDWPRERVELQPVILERTEFDAYTCEKIIIQSEANMKIPMYMLIPRKAAKGNPAILCLHGHGAGKDDVMGIQHGERQREVDYKELNYHIAPRLAEDGFVVLVPDARGFGERSLGYGKPHRHGEKDGCDLVFLKSIMMGFNPLTLNIWDIMRCIDYLETREEVDPGRIGSAGLSFGGAWSLYATVFEERIKASAVCGYFNTFESFAINWGNFCGSMTIPNVLKYGEMADVAALIAPRPLLISNGNQDHGFPIEASIQAFPTLEKAYQAAGYPDRVKHDVFDGGHEFHYKAVVDWMKQWL
ncbi:alpha/beta hydrolase family protein [Paenibacillus eucommiae]|uniref:Dienelactone hydrolase n=1 Tax=Paenibacillus eucommiae TaxID=1355755 RepID=A0ABS4IXJ1_9BACL|nr:alpha/beta hydrolase family protein [Paenibacillus eucommiae]MBP1992299.1 dienelactone hydrolase [Paenibacillus eucommiae]